MSSTALFVYGTLRRGCANRHAGLLDRSAAFLVQRGLQEGCIEWTGIPE